MTCAKKVKRSEGRPHDFSGASMSDNVDVATTTTATVMTTGMLNLWQDLDNYDKDDKDDDDNNDDDDDDDDDGDDDDDHGDGDV